MPTFFGEALQGSKSLFFFFFFFNLSDRITLTPQSCHVVIRVASSYQHDWRLLNNLSQSKPIRKRKKMPRLGRCSLQEPMIIIFIIIIIIIFLPNFFFFFSLFFWGRGIIPLLWYKVLVPPVGSLPWTMVLKGSRDYIYEFIQLTSP